MVSLWSTNRTWALSRGTFSKKYHSLRWGWVFLERMRILSGIQFTTYFIKIFVVETKRFVGSFLNVILTWQTCGQRSIRAAQSKRRALGNYFSERICYMFLISKCRGDRDLGPCTIWVRGHVSAFLYMERQTNNSGLWSILYMKRQAKSREKLCLGTKDKQTVT